MLPPPTGVTAAIAFSRRLRTTTSSASGSVSTYRPRAISAEIVIRSLAARSSNCATTRATAPPSSSGSRRRSTRPRSRRTLSRICVTMASMRARSDSMRSMSVRDCSGDSGRIAMVSSESCRLASGVLNWCDTRARKLSCSCITLASARSARAMTPMHTPNASRKKDPSHAYWLMRRCALVSSI